MVFILLLIILYVAFKEPTWQEECYKKHGGGKCGGIHGGDSTTNYLSSMCVDCPYLKL